MPLSWRLIIPSNTPILDDSIVFSTKGSDSAAIGNPTFTVDTNVFLAALQKQTGLQTNVRPPWTLLSNVGLDLSPPKTIFFNHGLGVLYRSGQRGRIWMWWKKRCRC